jgi:ABC-type glycerol-3-phosphate transport system permease component
MNSGVRMVRAGIRYAALCALATVMVYPFAWMLATSLKTLPESTRSGLRLLPESPQWENYREALGAAPFGRYFANTFLVAGATTAAVVLTSLFAGYAFARMEFRGRRILFGAVLATMMIPFEAALIPNFITITRLDWYNSYAALIVPWCANAFSIFLVRQACLTIPRDYLEAARIDGCGHVRFVFTVAAPMIRATLAAVALFAFLASYNSLLWPLVVTGDDSMRVVQVGLTVFAIGEGVRTNLLMCAAAVVMLPTVVLYFFAQRLFVHGAVNAGIKG